VHSGWHAGRQGWSQGCWEPGLSARPRIQPSHEQVPSTPHQPTHQRSADLQSWHPAWGALRKGELSASIRQTTQDETQYRGGAPMHAPQCNPQPGTRALRSTCPNPAHAALLPRSPQPPPGLKPRLRVWVKVRVRATPTQLSSSAAPPTPPHPHP